MLSFDIERGVVSGFLATLILSLVMIANNALGVVPQLNVITLLTQFAHKTVGTPLAPGIGWVMHFTIGSCFWGVLFAITSRWMPFSAALMDALSFATMAWVLMMLILMPLTGNGLFGLELAFAVPIATFVLHVFWGSLLGIFYGMLRAKDSGEVATVAAV